MTKGFLARNLFDIKKTSSHDKADLTDGVEYDYVTRTVLNRGICEKTGFIDAESLNEAGTFSLELMNLTFFYREKPWYAGQFVRKIVPKNEEICKQWLYFEVLFSRMQELLKSVLVRDVEEVFNNFVFMLQIQVGKNNIPIIDMSHTYHEEGYIPDWEYMSDCIRQCEREKVTELEKDCDKKIRRYLDIADLDTYLLTDEDNMTLQLKKKYSVFNVKDLFGKSTRGKRLKSLDRIAGELPFVTAGEENEGISAYIGNNVDVFEANTVTIDMFGSAKYRDYKYGADDHIAVVHTEKLNKNAAIFVTACLHKVSYTGKFNYANNFYAKDADALNIFLPIQCRPNGQPKINRKKNYNACGYVPDWDYMEKYISIIHKLTITDMVQQLNSVIKTAQQIVK